MREILQSQESQASPIVQTASPAPFHLVDRPKALLPLLAAVQGAETVAMDTEADSLHHYHEKTCLVQLTIRDEHWIVDPLAEGLDLTPLARQLEDRSLILHGADYDLRMLRRAWGFRPRRLMDTMLAAQLLGWTEIGLAALVERICGVVLSKHGQRADWSERPLTPGLLTYAVDDTRYLHRVAEAMADDLRALGRMQWLEESCERQLRVAGEDDGGPRQDPEAWRVKGGRSLKGRAAALLRELWLWRDAIAARVDRPQFRVAANALLLEWANWLAEHPDATMDQAPERPAWLRGGRRASFDQAIERVLAMPEADFPPPVERKLHGRRFTQAEEDLLKRLLAARDAVAESLGLQSGVLGPRDAIVPLVVPRPADEDALRELGGLMRWQAHALAPALLPLIQAVAKPRERQHPASF